MAIFLSRKRFPAVFFFFRFWSSKPGLGLDSDSFEMLDPYPDPQLLCFVILVTSN